MQSGLEHRSGSTQEQGPSSVTHGVSSVQRQTQQTRNSSCFGWLSMRLSRDLCAIAASVIGCAAIEFVNRTDIQARFDPGCVLIADRRITGTNWTKIGRASCRERV